MVRAGELPTRLLSLQHNCDLVWSPELIDKKLIQTKRSFNNHLNSIDYTLNNGTLVFRTIPHLERGRLILQIGSSNPDLAVKAALKLINDVDGIDLNAGCPKHFSIHSGMGAALLSTPDLLCDILSTLVSKVGDPYNKPISVKIRLLQNLKDTLTLVERLCHTGIANLTVHCRTKEMRNREAPIRDYLSDIYKICSSNNVSLIINGGVQNRSHFLQLRDTLELPSDVGGMIAEAAEANPTVFQDNNNNNTSLDWWKVMDKYINLAILWENNFGNTKYMLSRIIPGKSPVFQYVTRCKNYDQLKHVQNLINSKDGSMLEDPTIFLTQMNTRKNKHKRATSDTTDPSQSQDKKKLKV